MAEESTELSVAYDTSPKGLSRYANARTFNNPLTLAPVVVGIGAGFMSFAWWGIDLIPAGIWALVTVSGGVGALSFLRDLVFRRETFQRAYLNEARAARNAYLAQEPQRLRVRLVEAGLNESADQVTKLEDKFQTFKGVLDDKFDSASLTYSRYLSVAQQVYLSGLDRLQDLATRVASVSTIDTDYISRTLDELGYSEGNEVQPGSQEEALLERRELFERAQKDRQRLLGENEAAMTALDRTSAELASIQTQGGRAKVDPEVAIAELRKLADRSHLYQKS